MNCPTGGYPTIRHNEIWNFTASLLSEVYHDVSIEPHLQRLTGEQYSLAWRMVHVLMLLRKVFGAVAIKELF